LALHPNHYKKKKKKDQRKVNNSLEENKTRIIFPKERIEKLLLSTKAKTN